MIGRPPKTKRIRSDHLLVINRHVISDFRTKLGDYYEVTKPDANGIVRNYVGCRVIASDGDSFTLRMPKALK